MRQFFISAINITARLRYYPHIVYLQSETEKEYKMSRKPRHKVRKYRHVKEILREIIKAADRTFIENANLAEFENGLTDEVIFLVLCDRNKKKELENYIRQHAKVLYEFALSLQNQDH